MQINYVNKLLIGIIKGIVGCSRRTLFDIFLDPCR